MAVGSAFTDMNKLSSADMTANMRISSLLVCQNSTAQTLTGLQLTLADKVSNSKLQLDPVGQIDSAEECYIATIAPDFLRFIRLGYYS